MTAVGWILLGIVLAAAMVTFGRWAYDDGVRAGYNRGRREIDKWWIEMDQQLDEEWAKIWRENRKPNPPSFPTATNRYVHSS